MSAARCYDRRLPRGFVGIWTPGRMYLCRELSRPQMDLLVEIDALSTDAEDRGCWACDRYLGRFLGMHEDHVARLVRALMEAGFLTRQVVEDATRPGGRYRFLKLTRKALDLWLPLDGSQKSEPEREPEEGWVQDAPTSVPGGLGARCTEGVGASCPPMSTKGPEELYEEKQQQQYSEYRGRSASSGSEEKAAGKTALKAAAACLDIKSAPDLLLPEPEAGSREPRAESCLTTYEAEQSLIALGMAPEVARSLLKRFEAPAVLYWILRAEGKSNPSGFIRSMLEKNAPRTKPPPPGAEKLYSTPDAQAEALYRKTREECRARQEGGPTTEEAWGQAMTSLAEMAPWARAELERRMLLREKRLARGGGAP